MTSRQTLYPVLKQAKVSEHMALNLKSFADYLGVSEPEIIRRALEAYFRAEQRRISAKRDRPKNI